MTDILKDTLLAIINELNTAAQSQILSDIFKTDEDELKRYYSQVRINSIRSQLKPSAADIDTYEDLIDIFHQMDDAGIQAWIKAREMMNNNLELVKHLSGNNTQTSGTGTQVSNVTIVTTTSIPGVSPAHESSTAQSILAATSESSTLANGTLSATGNDNSTASLTGGSAASTGTTATSSGFESATFNNATLDSSTLAALDNATLAANASLTEALSSSLCESSSSTAAASLAETVVSAVTGMFAVSTAAIASSSTRLVGGLLAAPTSSASENVTSLAATPTVVEASSSNFMLYALSGTALALLALCYAKREVVKLEFNKFSATLPFRLYGKSAPTEVPDEESASHERLLAPRYYKM